MLKDPGFKHINYEGASVTASTGKPSVSFHNSVADIQVRYQWQSKKKKVTTRVDVGITTDE